MEPASPARLYAALAGAVLLVLGIVGFFYDASFTGLHDTEPALGALQVNAWFNLLYVATGSLGVLLAGASSRPYCLGVGLLYTLLAIAGWGSEGLHLALGLLGLAAAAGTPREQPRSEPRAKAARHRA
jgi:hypothetical protein